MLIIWSFYFFWTVHSSISILTFENCSHLFHIHLQQITQVKLLKVIVAVTNVTLCVRVTNVTTNLHVQRPPSSFSSTNLVVRWPVRSVDLVLHVRVYDDADTARV